MGRLAAITVIAAAAWAAPPAAAGGFECPAAPAGFEAAVSNDGVPVDVPTSANATKFVNCGYFRAGSPDAFSVGARWDESGPNDDNQVACGIPEYSGSNPISGYVYSQDRAAHVSYTVTTGTGPAPSELRAMAVTMLPAAEARAVACAPRDDGDAAGAAGGESVDESGESGASAGSSDDGSSSSKTVPVVAVVGGVVVILVGGVVVKRLGKAKK